MSAAMLWCRLCKKEREDATGSGCPDHPSIELTAPPARTARPAPADAEPGWARAVCWNCGAESTNRSNDICVECHESLVPPALAITFPNGKVVLPGRNESADLGRAGSYGHVFASYPNVSRAHARVGVDANGDAWLEPDPAAPNGTFVNDIEIRERTGIKPGDRIRFAADRGPHIGPTSEPVRLPQREPIPATDP